MRRDWRSSGAPAPQGSAGTPPSRRPWRRTARSRDEPSLRSPATQAVAGRSLAGARSLASEECPPVTAELDVAVNLLWLAPGRVGGSEQYLVRQLAGLPSDSGI